jgi:hypothetical protein
MVNSEKWHKSSHVPRVQQAWRFPSITRDDGDDGELGDSVYLTENTQIFIFCADSCNKRPETPIY